MKAVKTYVIKASSGVIPALMPIAHIYILYKFWGKYSRRVDKRYCSCSCWDTVFKGTYESGIASYKHMYFNATANTMKIWLITVTCIIILYECLKSLIKLFLDSHLRPLMAVLFMSSIFSHYYTWWVYVNYWNDDFYLQWNHQLFFTLTEIASTALVLHLSNSKISINPRKIFIIISIAVIHILSGGLDQFVRNIIWGEGFAHQVLRDLAFVVPDILHVVLPSIELLKSRKHLPPRNIKNDFMYMISLIVCGFLEISVHRTVTKILFMSLLNWLVGSIALTIFFISIIGRPEKPLTFHETLKVVTEPEAALHELNMEIRGKSVRLELLVDKIQKMKKTITKLNLKRGEIQLKYNDMLNNLRSDLSKCESECLLLHSQIDKLMEKKNKINSELLETAIQVPIPLSDIESNWL